MMKKTVFAVRILALAVLVAFPGVLRSQSLLDYMPEINGTVRAKYEYQPETEAGRFEVRNARLSVSGKVISVISYKAEVDLCDEGKIKMLDAYARFTPIDVDAWLTLGQMRVPFTIDAHRAPHQQFFANRSFIAKQVGNVRDVGMSGMYRFGWQVPLTLQAGVFNGSGLTGQKDYWTRSYNFSVKATAEICSRVTVSASCQKTRPDGKGIMMWDMGAFYDDGMWHVEGEYLRKNYSGGAFTGVNAVDAFVVRRIGVGKTVESVSVLGRYDYMSDHSTGLCGDDGVLSVDDPERHRVTGGVTLHFGKKRLYADLRINYEKYFYNEGVTIPVSEQDKFVVEIMCRF